MSKFSVRWRGSVRTAVAYLGLSVILDSVPAIAQEGAPDLSSLKPTSAPAFLLLNVSPSEVERPSTPADLAFSLVNGTGLLSELPENFALESAPYWLTTHETLRWQDDDDRSTIESIARTLSFSFATAEIGDEDAPVTGLSFGGRTMLLSGRYSQATRDSLEAMASALAKEGSLNHRISAEQRANLDLWLFQARSVAQTDAAREAIRQEYIQRRNAIDDQVLASPEYQREAKALRERFDDVALRRVGHMLEIAGGAAWGFPDRVWESGKLRRWAAWASYGCEGCAVFAGGTPITPVLMVRYLGGDDDVDGDVVDIGGRLIVSDPRYGFSVEGVWRQFMGDDPAEDLYRIAGTFEYQVREDMWLQATFGRDQDASLAGSLLAQLGFKFNFAETRYTPTGGQ